jgi:hypothetical protein
LSEGGEEEGEFVAPRPNATGEKKIDAKGKKAVKSAQNRPK